MPALPQAINPNEIPERSDYSPFPPGSYTMMIVNSDLKATKDGTGQMLVLEMDVTEGDHQGRKIFENLNLVNQSQQAVEIAYKTLGEIARACGKGNGIVNSSEELHNIRFLADVVIKPGKGDYGPSNKVNKYHALGSGTTAAATAPASGATANTRPWAK